MFTRTLGISLVVAAAVMPQAALADVKAGIDAWGRNDFSTAVREWQGPADKGDPDAQFNLGQAYKLGRGVKADLQKAEQLFGQAAEKGHIQAADMYGLLLFQRGERAKAMPYVRGAADRGEPRAQYLLGVAHFNGDHVPKDWVRAYALTSLAQHSGIEQAKSALAQMDRYIPLEQRQQGVALSRELASQADATRTRQLTALDLGTTVPTTGSTPPVSTPARQPSVSATASDAAAVARAAADNSPRTAGADYARPQMPRTTPPAVQPPVTTPPAARPVPPAVVAAPAAPRAPAAVQAPAAVIAGPWRVQLGAFAVAGNATALWNRVKDRPELAGHPRETAPAGRLTTLFAGGFASREAARSACSRLTAAGFACLVTRK